MAHRRTLGQMPNHQLPKTVFLTGKHFCQSELQGTVENRLLVAGGVAFEVFLFWKDDHLQTSEYYLHAKYKRGSDNNNGECDL